MQVRVQKLVPEAVVPKYAKEGDAGLDLVAITHDSKEGYESYGTGLAFEIPKGHVGLLFPRSSVTNKDLILKNGVGVIDSGYRGEISFRFQRVDGGQYTYAVGDRIGQLIVIPIPHIELVEVQELSQSDRGTGGYGSTGK